MCDLELTPRQRQTIQDWTANCKTEEEVNAIIDAYIEIFGENQLAAEGIHILTKADFINHICIGVYPKSRFNALRIAAIRFFLRFIGKDLVSRHNAYFVCFKTSNLKTDF